MNTIKSTTLNSLAALGFSLLIATVDAQTFSPISASASSVDFAERDTTYAINGAGLSAAAVSTGFTHGISANNEMWNTYGRGTDNNPWIMFDLGTSYNVTNIHVWNFNEKYGSSEDTNLSGFGMKDVNVSAGATAESLSPVGTFQFSRATGTDLYAGEIISVSMSSVRFVRFTPLNTWSGTIFGDNYSTPPGDEGRGITGLSEVKFTGSAVPEPASFATFAGLGMLGYAFIRRRRSGLAVTPKMQGGEI